MEKSPIGTDDTVADVIVAGGSEIEHIIFFGWEERSGKVSVRIASPTPTQPVTVESPPHHAKLGGYRGGSHDATTHMANTRQGRGCMETIT